MEDAEARKIINEILFILKEIRERLDKLENEEQ
jgi:hypothetical protein